jgi:hypothetical protein
MEAKRAAPVPLETAQPKLHRWLASCGGDDYWILKTVISTVALASGSPVLLSTT